ncbi:phage capsid family protein [Bartonella sp. B30(2025)]
MTKNHIKQNRKTALETYFQFFNKEIAKITPIAALIGKSDNNIIQLKEAINKGSNDTVIVNMRSDLTHNGVSEFMQLGSSEEELYFLNDSININKLSHAVHFYKEETINQNMMRNLHTEAKRALINWYAVRLTRMFFMQVCGYTASHISYDEKQLQIFPMHYGFNTPTQPTDKRIIRPNGKTADEDLYEKDIFSLDLIDQAIERVKREKPKMKPVYAGGEEFYVLYLHPQQVDQLRKNTEKKQWLEITNEIHKGDRMKSPLFDRALGVYNGVILHETDYVTPGVQIGQENSAYNTTLQNVRRAVLLGAQSAILAIGKGKGMGYYQLVKESLDYDDAFGMAIRSIVGMKKTRFHILPQNMQYSESMYNVSQQDFGALVLPTYVETETH